MPLPEEVTLFNTHATAYADTHQVAGITVEWLEDPTQPEPEHVTLEEIYADDARAIAHYHIMERFWPETCPMLAAIHQAELAEKRAARQAKKAYRRPPRRGRGNPRGKRH